MQASQQDTIPTLRNFLKDDQDMPEEPPTVVQSVMQQMPLAHATETSLNCPWSVMPGEQTRRMSLAQPAWKTQLQ